MPVPMYRNDMQYQCVNWVSKENTKKKKKERNWEDKDKIDRKSDSIREKKKFWKEEGKEEEEEGEEDKRKKNHIVSR